MTKNDFRNSDFKVLYIAFLFSGIYIRALGNVYLGEIILSLFILVKILNGKKLFLSLLASRFIRAAIVWFIANGVSSIYREKSLSLILISIFTVILTVLSFAAIAHVFEKYPDKLTFSIILYCLGKILGFLVQPGPYTSVLPWKFGFGEPIILVTLVLVGLSRKNYITLFALSLLIFISVTNEARTLSFICLFAMTAFLLMRIKIFSSKKYLYVLVLALVPIIYSIYLQLALSGLLGAHEAERALILTNSDLGPFAARKEFIFSIQAFIKNPIIGYGFNPEVSSNLIMRGYQTLNNLGIKVEILNDTDIPIHSFLMSAFVQGGIFAGIFWIYALKISFSSLLRLPEIQVHQVPILAYLAATMIDKILFSPFGALERMNSALFLVLLIHMRSKLEK